MDKERVSDSIDTIIQDLTNPTKTLEDCLRKTLVLAYQLKNDKLKTWAQNELNGYSSDEALPEYRLVGFEVKAAIRQVTMGGILSETINIPYQTAKHTYFVKLRKGFPLVTNVAGLQSVVAIGEEGTTNALSFNLNPYVANSLQDILQGWFLKMAWIQVSDLTITALLSNIKNKLLQFLLDLDQETGNETDYLIMKNSEKVDKIIEHTIGHIHAGNVTFNGNTYQTKGNQNNVVQGNNNTQHVAAYETLTADIREFVQQINKVLDTATDVLADTKEDVSDQLRVIGNQLNRETPRLDIINKSLQLIEGFLLNIAATVYTPLALELLRRITHQIQLT